MTVDTAYSGTSAYQTLNAMLQAAGIGALADDLVKFMQQGITDQATLTTMLRQTDAYKNRFPGMDNLLKMGLGYNEGYYISYEQNAAQLENQFGLPRGFLSDPHRVTQLIEKNVSASDLTDRVKLNAAVAMDAPQETRQALADLYGIDQNGLTAYYLDPDNSVPYLQRQYASATIAGQAAKQQIAVDRQVAETLADQGITQAQAAQGFANVAQQQAFSAGAGETATQADLINAQFGDAAAQQKVQRVASGRQAQFAGGGNAQASQSGVTGLGQSSTR